MPKRIGEWDESNIRKKRTETESNPNDTENNNENNSENDSEINENQSEIDENQSEIDENQSENDAENDENQSENDESESGYSSGYYSSELGLADLIGSSDLSDGSDGSFSPSFPPLVTLRHFPHNQTTENERDISVLSTRELIESGISPNEILGYFGLIVDIERHPNDNDVENWTERKNNILWQIIKNIKNGVKYTPPRERLGDYETLEDAVELIRKSQRILVLTGAGISVSCGIPDFRSKNGIYARLKEEFDLPEPESMFDMHYFIHDPKPFFSFAKDLYPGKFQPSPSHFFIRNLEKSHKLLRNYTQNIDTLETVAGIEKVLQCHGSFSQATCMTCRKKYSCEDIREDIMAQRIPYCEECIKKLEENKEEDDKDDNVIYGVIKPDITFFHEDLDDTFYSAISSDRSSTDLIIIMGSSLQVEPVCRIVTEVPRHIPQILINRNIVGKPNKFDVNLLGDCDEIVRYLSRKLNFDDPSSNNDIIEEPIQIDVGTFAFKGAVYNETQQNTENNNNQDEKPSHD